MPFIITEPCVDTKDGACVDVCPVDCIHGNAADPQFYIDPAVCIDCGACVPVCPVEAIYSEADVPGEWENYTEINAEYFRKG
jgi:ferredoxin